MSEGGKTGHRDHRTNRPRLEFREGGKGAPRPWDGPPPFRMGAGRKATHARGRLANAGAPSAIGPGPANHTRGLYLGKKGVEAGPTS